MNNSSRFLAGKQWMGGGGPKTARAGVGDPSPPYKIQSNSPQTSIPEYVIPYRPMTLRFSGGFPTVGPSRMTNVQRMVLGVLSRIVLDEEERALIRAEIFEGQRYG